MSPTTFTTLTAHDQWRTFLAMEKHGGGFCSALAQAWYKADQNNKRRIEIAFPHLLESFGPNSSFFYMQNQ
jgi:hypothetical protein